LLTFKLKTMDIISLIGDSWQYIVGGLGGFAGLSGVRFVKEGELGSKTLLGKAIRFSNGKIKVYKAGFAFLIPGLHAMKWTHIRMQTIKMSDQNVTLKNGLSYHYDVAMAYHVSDNSDSLDKYLYQVDKPVEAIELKLAAGIREILSEKQSADEIDLKEINKNLKENLESYLSEHIGVTLDSCGLTSFTESTTAQGVRGVEAKLKTAEIFFGSKDKIPAAVVAACLGSASIIPISSDIPS
jgi:regulator of protease activity HflC (stomatin/prohibitin superfamily)